MAFVFSVEQQPEHIFDIAILYFTDYTIFKALYLCLKGIESKMESTDIADLANIARNQLGLGSMDVIEMAVIRSIARSESYLKKRKKQGSHTAYDDAVANDCALIALLLMLAKGEQKL